VLQANSEVGSFSPNEAVRGRGAGVTKCRSCAPSTPSPAFAIPARGIARPARSKIPRSARDDISRFLVAIGGMSDRFLLLPFSPEVH
jgi:hypothetical protein